MHLFHLILQHVLNRGSREGPAQQRRHQKRAFAREAATVEEVKRFLDDNKTAAFNKETKLEIFTSEAVGNKAIENDITDEFCEDIVCNRNAVNDTSKENVKNCIDRVLVTPEGAGSWNKETISKPLEDRLRYVGINPKLGKKSL